MNKKGFSLLQLITGASLFAMISTATMKIITSQSKAFKSEEHHFRINSTFLEIGHMLSKDSFCTTTFAASQITGNGARNKTIEKGTLIYNSGKKISTNLHLKEIYLDNVANLGADDKGVIDVNVIFEKTKDGVVTEEKRSLKILVTTDSSSRISECIEKISENYDVKTQNSISSSLNSMCISIGGNFNSATNECDIDFSEVSALKNLGGATGTPCDIEEFEKEEYKKSGQTCIYHCNRSSGLWELQECTTAPSTPPTTSNPSTIPGPSTCLKRNKDGSCFTIKSPKGFK